MAVYERHSVIDTLELFSSVVDMQKTKLVLSLFFLSTIFSLSSVAQEGIGLKPHAKLEHFARSTGYEHKLQTWLKSGAAAPFFFTKALYNGSFTGAYNGLMQACQTEKAGSKPCTESSLIRDEFWNYNILSWFMSAVYNCVGWTDDKDSMGYCAQTYYGKQIVPCSCDMKMPVCCTDG